MNAYQTKDTLGFETLHVVLSERNLKTLSGMVGAKDAEAAGRLAIRGNECSLFRRLGSGVHLIVSVEPDETHYKDREAGSDDVIEAALNALPLL